MNKNLSATVKQTLIKVPEVTLIFWIIKVLTTGMGEVFADFSADMLTLPLATTIAGFGLAVALGLQFKVRRYVPWIYWLAVVMVSIFGTMFADILSRRLGIPLIVSSSGFIIAQVIIFIVWYGVEKTLSFHNIRTPRREFFYWLTVIDTFALGTALGDFTAFVLHWGFLLSGIIFAILIAIPAIGYRWFKMNAIFSFWFAYIITRPLGASFTDWLSMPAKIGGLAIDRGLVSFILIVIIFAFVAYLTVKEKNANHNKQESYDGVLQANK
ncbi:Hypothetical protein LUCI_4806 [Lucifera butyrica]|uniref:Membrane-anchored protein n=1 Tax=Lucifera butyrica TaxID=1351585 RepID=A0A498RDG8_9FIRM|nr:hypothetical protein [Lucifera butyrica]VBB09511.1 Hypothetical protein LUCI_4806 [Lucifera butyrica]